MTQSVVGAQSPMEFFKEQVEAACARQDVCPHPATAYYIVTLLSDFVRLEPSAPRDVMGGNEALGVTFVRALQSGGRRQREDLKQVGDAALFLAGFFSDSLRRRLVDVDYFMSLGGHAYGSLSAIDEVRSETYGELSDKFVAFVDVLSDVSTRTSLTNDADLLRLYEKWIRTGSRLNGQLLAEHGIVPNASLLHGPKRLH